MKIRPAILITFIVWVLTLPGNHLFAQQLTIAYDTKNQQLAFGIAQLEAVVHLKTITFSKAVKSDIVVVNTATTAKAMGLQKEFSQVKAEGFQFKKRALNKLAIIAKDTAGAMYGLLELAEQLEIKKTLQAIDEKIINPKLAFRAIKFNLPWMSYREHESLALHTETCRDLSFWKKMLDMMAINRFNTLTLWNLHPFHYMIKPTNFPEASPFTDAEMKEWQNFWHGLFAMAKERNIKTFIINWNIYVSPAFAEAHNVAPYSKKEMAGKNYLGKGDYSALVQRYNRECMTQLINEYPELSGIGVSQNERMEGVDEQVWQNWIVDTYYTAMESADHPIEFMMRGHTHPAPALTRKALDDNQQRLKKKPVWVELKFNWSHGHASPHLFYIHGGSVKSDVLWKPAPTNHKIVWTIRNEDFFILRWGQPNFIRALINNNSQDYIGGFMVGSETYIPAKEYITKPGSHLTWQYAFEKQWLFYKMWGRLLYDAATPDLVFENEFSKKFNINFGNKLIQAHKKADNMPLWLAGYYGATWDFTLYSEGFMAGYPAGRGELFDSSSAFISVEEIINAVPLDTNLISVKNFVAGKGKEKISPLQLADILQKEATEALTIAGTLNTSNPTLQHEIADIKVWSYLGLYFSEKLRGAVALEQLKKYHDESQRQISITHLEKALAHWDKVIEYTDPYLDEIPLIHFGDAFIKIPFKREQKKFSWKNFRPEVELDIMMVKEWKQ
jgi:hypothetical protein